MSVPLPSSSLNVSSLSPPAPPDYLSGCVGEVPWSPSQYPDLYTPSSPSWSLHWTYRDSQLVNLPISLLVEGDIIALRPGQEAFASLRGIKVSLCVHSDMHMHTSVRGLTDMHMHTCVQMHRKSHVVQEETAHYGLSQASSSLALWSY